MCNSHKSIKILIKIYNMETKISTSNLKGFFSQDGDRFYIKELSIPLEEQTNFEKVLKQLKEMQNPFIVNLKEYEKIDENNYKLILDYFDYDLNTDLNTRRKSREHYNESELWLILKRTIQGLMFFHELGLPHKRIEPQYIKIAIDKSDEIEIRIMHPLLESILNLDGNSVQTERLYYSPEEFITLKYKNNPLSVDYYKSDVFCLGFTFLEIATLFSLASCYDWHIYLLNYEFIIRKLMIVQNKYSRYMAYVLKKMLVLDEEKRTSFEELDGYLTKEYIDSFNEQVRNL